MASGAPDTGLPAPLAALWWDGKGDWARAHGLVGEPETVEGMAVHAYLHRKEGNASNAEYWYQRAGRAFHRPSLEAEWAALVEGLLSGARRPNLRKTLPEVSMPKTKTVLDKKEPTNLISVGLPQVPAVYGLKPRKNYLPWSHAEKRLARSRNCWICTSRPDGRPHSMPVWGSWTEGALYFGTGRSTRKGKNLAHNKAVSIHLESGDDAVILEGNAVEVNDKPLLKRLDEAYRAKYKTPLLIAPESAMYCVRPRIAWAWTEKNYANDATRWEFKVSD